MSKTVGELLAATLADAGVTQIFGIVGDALNPFTDAIRREKRLAWLGVRHEEGAALAATGQAKLTGKLGVCAGTAGPGATHLLAGLYEARHDHAPVLAIAGDLPTGMNGIDYLQAADHVQTFRDACVYVTSINSADAAPAQIHEAIATAYGERGVALINIPQDVFGAKTSRPALSPDTLRQRPEVAPAESDVAAAAKLIDGAGSVVLFVGHGARSARIEVGALAAKLNAPIVHTYRALDLYPFDDPLVIGGLGLIGSRAGFDAIHRCEALIMIGSDYPYSEFLPKKAKVIQIDERAFAIGRRLPVECAIVGSSGPACAALLARVKAKDDAFLKSAQKDWDSWKKMLTEKADVERSKDRIHPQALARAASDLAADDAVFCVDTGEVTLWTGNWLRPRGHQRITGSYNNAAVGVALGMANGIQALDKNRQVIAMCGDGGFAMLMQEFVTSAQHGLPIKAIVFNNSGWGLVHLEMEEAGLPVFEPGAVVKNPDFAMFAKACGGTGFRVTRPQALRETIREALATPGPVIVDVVVDPTEIPSMPHIHLDQVWKFGIGKLRELGMVRS